jgi:restriction system protein
MTVGVPAYTDLLWPALQAVIALGGSASIAELDAAVIDREQFSPESQSVLHGEGPSTEIQYRLAWARTYLKGMGLLTNSQRGVWSVTEAGQTASEDQIPKLHAEFVASSRREGRNAPQSRTSLVRLSRSRLKPKPIGRTNSLKRCWLCRHRLSSVLAQRLLRESGFSRRGDRPKRRRRH